MEIRKNKTTLKNIGFFNEIRTHLLIYSNSENQEYLKNTKVLINSIQPQDIIKKFDNFEVKFENPIISSNTEFFSEFENSKKEILNNILNENILKIGEFFNNIKITCSSRKLKRNSINENSNLNFMENNSQNNEKNKCFRYDTNNSNRYLSIDKKNLNLERNYKSNKKLNYNSNSFILSNPIIYNNLNNIKELEKSRNIQEGFEKLQKLAISLKLINVKSNNLKYNSIKYDDLLDILEYRGLEKEKDFLNERVQKSKKSNKFKTEIKPKFFTSCNFDNSKKNNFTNLKENNNDVFFNFNKLKDENKSKKDSENSIDEEFPKERNTNIIKPLNFNIDNINNSPPKSYKEFQKENYNTNVSKKKMDDFSSPKNSKEPFSPYRKSSIASGTKSHKPPRVIKYSENSITNQNNNILGYSKKDVSPKFNKGSPLKSKTFFDLIPMESDCSNTKKYFFDKKYTDLDSNNDNYRDKIKYPPRSKVLENKNSNDINDHIIFDEKEKVEVNEFKEGKKNFDQNNLNDFQYKKIYDIPKNENKLIYLYSDKFYEKDYDDKIIKKLKSSDNSNKNNCNDFIINKILSPDYKKNMNSNIFNKTKQNSLPFNKSKTPNLTDNMLKKNIPVIIQNSEIRTVNNFPINNNNQNYSNNTIHSVNTFKTNAQSNYITNDFKDNDNAHITSNSILSNNFNDYNSNVYNNKSNFSNHGFSSVSFYEMNSENGIESDHNSNLVTKTNYVSNVNNNDESNIYNSENCFDSNIYRNIDNYEEYQSVVKNKKNFQNGKRISKKIKNYGNESDNVSDISKNSHYSSNSKNYSIVTRSSCSDLDI